MFIFFSDSFQLGVDCAAALDAQRHIVFGWHMTPRGVPAELRVATADGRDCRIEYLSRHARPDVVPPDPSLATVGGFTLVAMAPPGARGLVVTLGAGDLSGRANLSDASVNTDLFRATADRDWATTFALMRECQDRPDALPLLGYQYRPFGAFADWMGRLPLIQAAGRNIGVLAEIAAIASPAGEVLIDLRFVGRARGAVLLDAVAMGRLRSEDGGPDEIVLLPLEDCILRHGPAASALYARIGWGHVARLRALDVIVQVGFDAERVWLRCQPGVTTVPAFLDALGAQPTGRAGQALLREVLDRRHASFAPMLRRGPAAEVRGEAGLPDLALIGVDDIAAVPFLHLIAPELEARAGAILVLGHAAEAVAQVFARRGRVPVAIAEEAGAVMERAEAVGHGNLVALDLARLAQASIAGRLPSLIERALAGGLLGRLFLLHGVAGCTAALGDSLARLAALTDDPTEPWNPVSRDWSSPLGAELVNAHLEALWRAAPELAA